jgi:hypothetical protein
MARRKGIGDFVYIASLDVHTWLFICGVLEMTTGFLSPVTTPNGPGLLIARFTDGMLLVTHRPRDIADSVKLEYWKGGPCVFIQYAAEEVKDVIG